MKEEVICRLWRPVPFRRKRPELTADEFDTIAEAFPDYLQGSEAKSNILLEIRFFRRSPDEDRVVHMLQRFGIKLRWQCYPSIVLLTNADPMLMQMEGLRHYEPQDLERAEWFVMTGVKKLGEMGSRDARADGRLRLDRTYRIKVRKKIPSVGFISPFGWVLASTDSFHRHVLAQGFEGLTFRDILYDDGSIPDPATYEWWSDVELPPMANPRVYADGRPWDGRRDEALYYEDIFRPAHIQYRRSELQPFANVDVAVAAEHEMVPIGNWRDGSLIVSRRFRQWCLAQKGIEFEFRPVELLDS